MRNYETGLILDTMISEEAIDREIKKVEAKLAAAGAELIKTDVWGKRKLAYDINKKSHGFYVFFYYKATATLIADLERDFRINENVLRWMTLADQPVPTTTRQEAEAAAAEAEAEVEDKED